MKYLKVLVCVAFSFFLIFSSAAISLAQSEDFATEQDTSNSALGKVIFNQISTDSSSDQVGPHFRAAENLIISNEYIGDVYAAGGTVQVPGTVTGDLLVTGGTVSVDGTVTQDVRVGGGTIVINGQIGGNVTVMGGNITFSQGSTVGGSVVVFGGSVTMLGTVEGNVYGAAGTVAMSGNIGNNMVIDSGNLSVPATASISGSLTARVSESSTVDPAANISGSQDIQLVQHSAATQDSKKDVAEFAGVAIFSKFIFASLMSIVGGSVLLAIFPRFFITTSQLLRSNVWPAVGWGIAISFITPILCVFLLITVIGIPVAILTLLLWIAAIISASWFSMYIIGGLIAEKIQSNWMNNKYLQLVVGVVVVQLLGLVPVVGWVIEFCIYAMGMGAIFLWLKTQMRASVGSQKRVN